MKGSHLKLKTPLNRHHQPITEVKEVSISVVDYGEIRKLYNDGQSQREISKKLGISRKTVKKYCKGESVPWNTKAPERKSTVVTEDVMAFINKCLEDDEGEGLPKQKYISKRIYDRLVSEKGFNGGESTIRRIVAELRGKRDKAFIPLAFEPAEAMQIDWGEAYVILKGKKTKIYYFCARLCYSCKSVVLAYSHQNEESFLDAHVKTFETLGGVPRRVIFDNGKVAVKLGFGAKAQMQEGYARLSAHYAFQVDFCNPASGNEKGLVEGLVGWIRRNILTPVPVVENLEELNALLAARCNDFDQHQIKGKPANVGEMFQKEKEALRPLPPFSFEVAKSQNARVSTFCTVRFQTNDYSVPAEYVGRQVGIKGYPETIEIYYEGKKIAEHARLFGKYEKSCRLVDYLELLGERRRAIPNAVPVKQNLSSEAYEELKANIDNPQKVKEILEREAKLSPEQASKPSSEEQPPIDDPVKIKKVNLKNYDSLMEQGERR